jgi:hypothetical protein
MTDARRGAAGDGTRSDAEGRFGIPSDRINRIAASSSAITIAAAITIIVDIAIIIIIEAERLSLADLKAAAIARKQQEGITP